MEPSVSYSSTGQVLHKTLPVTRERAGWDGHSDATAQKPTGNFNTGTDSSGKGSNKTSRRNF